MYMYYVREKGIASPIKNVRRSPFLLAQMRIGCQGIERAVGSSFQSYRYQDLEGKEKKYTEAFKSGHTKFLGY